MSPLNESNPRDDSKLTQIRPDLTSGNMGQGAKSKCKCKCNYTKNRLAEIPQLLNRAELLVGMRGDLSKILRSARFLFI